jgi:hypothetical protein
MATNITPRGRIFGDADDLNADQDTRAPGADNAGGLKWDENGDFERLFAGRSRSAPGQRGRRAALK